MQIHAPQCVAIIYEQENGKDMSNFLLKLYSSPIGMMMKSSIRGPLVHSHIRTFVPWLGESTQWRVGCVCSLVRKYNGRNINVELSGAT